MKANSHFFSVIAIFAITQSSEFRPVISTSSTHTFSDSLWQKCKGTKICDKLSRCKSPLQHTAVSKISKRSGSRQKSRNWNKPVSTFDGDFST